MKKVIIFLLLVGTSFSVYALPNEQNGAILEIFKKKQYDLLFESDLGDITAEDREVFNISNKIDIYENIQDNTSTKRELYEKKQLETVEKIISLEGQIEELDADIQSMTNNIAKTNNTIIEINDEVEGIKNTIAVLRKKILENRNILLEYLDYIYKKQNTLYIDNDIDNLKSILLNTEDISDLLNDLHFKSIIQITAKKLIDDHRRFVSDIYVKKIELEKKEVTLKKLRKSLIVQRSTLKDKKDFKERILEISKGKQSLYKKYIDDKMRLERNIQLKLIKEKIKFNVIKKNLLKDHGCEFVDVTKNSIELRTLSDKCFALNKIIYAESKLKNTGELGNIFDWPIAPMYGLSAYFHDDGYEKLFGSEHDAIDIITPQGTPVKAPADGYVMFIEPPETPDYSYLALRHADGYVTVYGHLSDVLVNEFDVVKKGQVFALSGGDFGTNGAGFMTTGSHLHMEVFQDKESVDPLNFLSLAELKFENVPEKYRFKFYEDFKEQKGYEYENKNRNTSVFKLDGSTEIERQQSLIDKYAVGAFRDWKMWVDESLDGNIDPTFVMCIGLAETGLGKNMKTPYNVGNVGNTDSGATKTYLNARSGIYWIVKTLNNRILGHYTQVRELSRYGNKTGPIYASSPDHWHNNIIKCMSHIKGRFISDDYEFRLISQ